MLDIDDFAVWNTTFPSKCSTEVLASIPKLKKAVVHLMEKTKWNQQQQQNMLDKHCFSMGYSAANSEFSIEGKIH